MYSIRTVQHSSYIKRARYVDDMNPLMVQKTEDVQNEHANTVFSVILRLAKLTC